MPEGTFLRGFAQVIVQLTYISLFLKHIQTFSVGRIHNSDLANQQAFYEKKYK